MAVWVVGALLAAPARTAEPDYTRPPQAKGKFARMWDQRDWDDYWVLMWVMGTSYQQKPVEQVFWKMRELGCNGGMAYMGGSDELLTRFFLPYYNENMHRIGYCKRQQEYMDLVAAYVKTRDKSLLVRKPCLDDPAWRDKVQQQLVALAKRRAPFRPVAYSIEDESSLTFFARDFDFDFSPVSLARFRDWLKEQYGTLQRLNAQWGSDFQDWNQVMPSTILEVLPRKDRNYSSWADHREYMDLSFARCLGGFEQAIRTVDPHTPVGLVGTQMPGVSTGYNYWLLCNHLTFLEPYDIGNSIECVRSFQQLGEHRVFWTTTTGVRPLEPTKFRLWRYLLHGAGGCIVWESSSIIKGSPPEITPEARAITPTFHELQGGIARLLRTAQRDDDPIALHYSQRSIRGRYLLRWAEKPGAIPYHEAASMVPVNSPMCHAWEGWTKLLEDLGLQYRFVASEQIERGDLSRQGYKVLILPLSVALSDEEIAEIEKFAEAGGVVIADCLTGQMDRHCKLLDRGRLDDFFGIRRDSVGLGRGVAGKTAGRKGPPGAPDFSSLDLADLPLQESIQAREGAPLAQAGAVPGLVVRKHGQGWSCYLNAEVKDYFKQRLEKEGGAAARQVVRELLALGGVRPRVELRAGDQPHGAGIEAFYFRSGNAHYLALLHNHALRQSELGEVKSLAWFGDTPPLTVRLPRKAFVYDVRGQRYLGETDTVAATIAASEPVIFALLPYRVEGIELVVKTEPGRLKFTARLQATGKPGTHVFRTRLLDPDGRDDEAYRTNLLAEGGSLAGDFVTSPDDKKGTWTFEITDVASGVSTRRPVEFR
jgi:hypothetical protein